MRHNPDWKQSDYFVKLAKVHQVSYHRNGVGGMGFHAVLFDDGKNGLMLGVVFDDPGYVSVFRVDLLSDPKIGVAFGENSWRGDCYEPALREAIETHDSDGSVRVGPFATPITRDAGQAP